VRSVSRSVFLYFPPSTAPVSIIPAQAVEDDTIPLTHPIRTASGILVDKISVAKGTFVWIPIGGMNKSEALWGPDAAKFDPGRWLVSDGESKSAMGRMEEVKGYKHLLTFAHGPRMCLGKNFALLAVKVRLLRLQEPLLSLLTRSDRRSYPFSSATFCSSFLVVRRRRWIAIRRLSCIRRWRVRKVRGFRWSLRGFNRPCVREGSTKVSKQKDMFENVKFQKKMAMLG